MTAPVWDTQPDRMRVLISFHYFRTTDLDRLFGDDWPGPAPEVFADSGAFSALTQGADVNLDTYAAWLERWGHWFQVAANLDTIGDGAEAAAGTRANQEALEERGLPVLPVFHAGEPWEALEHYLDSGYTYIALGGLVGRPVPSIMPWLVRCFRMAQGRAVFHGFGLTSWEPLAGLPWYSVDSSSWGASYRYGQLRLFDEANGRWVQAAVGNHAELYAPSVASLIRDHGYDPGDFADRERYTRERTCRISAVAWWRAEQWIRRRHGRIEMPASERPPGLRWYCADANPLRLSAGAAGLRMYLADTSTTGMKQAADERAHVPDPEGGGLKLYLASTTSDLPYVKTLYNEPHHQQE